MTDASEASTEHSVTKVLTVTNPKSGLEADRRLLSNQTLKFLII